MSFHYTYNNPSATFRKVPYRIPPRKWIPTAPAGNARSTQVPIEVLADYPAESRVTQVPIEVLADYPAESRVTHIAIEVLHRSPPGLIWDGRRIRFYTHMRL